MLFFRSEEQANLWCAQTGEPRGESLPLAKVWELSKAWYGDRMSPDYRGRSSAEIQHMFESLGLTSAFWQDHG